MKCLKQVVTATILRDSKVLVIGKNDISNSEVTECPRKGMKSGEGYDLCISICRQKGHAEVQVIEKAKQLGIDIKGATMEVEGHIYICGDCEREIIKSGLKSWYIKEKR